MLAPSVPVQPIFTPHLKKCVPICAAELEQCVQWDADDRRQSHEEADGHSPAWVLVVVVSDWPVLDHREDENELQRVERMRLSRAPPGPQACPPRSNPSSPDSQANKRCLLGHRQLSTPV